MQRMPFIVGAWNQGDCCMRLSIFFFFSSRRRHTRCSRDWSSDVCSSDLAQLAALSGTDARFYTGCAVIGPAAGVRLVHVDTTTVFFRALSAGEIERYVDRGDRERVVLGKRGDLGGRRIIKKKKKNQYR